MNLRVLLAVVDGTEGSEAVCKAALHLAKTLPARVEFLHVEIEPQQAVPVLGEGMSGMVVEQMIEALEKTAAEQRAVAERLFDELCRKAGIKVTDPDDDVTAGEFAASFRHLKGREPEEVRRRGRLADLVVLSRPTDQETTRHMTTLDAALFDSARPVLVVPGEAHGGFGQHVAVAWDGSREAARAVGSAMELLKRAEKVTIMTARDGQEEAMPSALARYLGAHGVRGETWAFSPEGDTGAALLEQIEKAEADLLLMGAYGHSRLREMVLGGATRTVLRSARVPVLMTH